MDFRYQPNFADNFHGVVLGIWGNRPSAVRYGVMCLGTGALVLVGLAAFGVPLLAAVLLGVVATLAWAALFTFGFGAWIAATLTRRQRAIGTARIVVTEEGLERITRAASTRQSWDAIVRIVETRRAFLFYDAEDPVFAIEKSAVETADELAALRRFLAARMSADNP